MEQLSMREIERRASLFYGDGVLEIAIGLGVLIFGVVLIFNLGPLAGAYLAVLVPIVRSARRRITFPRMYHFDFMPEPYTDLRIPRLSVIAGVSVAMALVVGVLVFLKPGIIQLRMASWLRANTIVAFGLLIAGVLVLIGWGARVRRLITYAAVSVAALICGYWFNVAPSYYFISLGLIILLCGGAALARFIRKYPKVDHWS